MPAIAGGVAGFANDITVITQCEIRKLYAKKNEPGVSEAIEVAKTCERRRCGHHPDEYPEPLSTLECMQSVVDPKDQGENKHRYVVASQSQEVRRMLRIVRGVPLIYIKRSVMILEPMSDESAATRAREEKSKFRAEIKATLGKRKREEKDDNDKEDEKDLGQAKAEEKAKKKKKKQRGPKGPNPLSMKRRRSPKRRPQGRPARRRDRASNPRMRGRRTRPGQMRRQSGRGGERTKRVARATAPTALLVPTRQTTVRPTEAHLFA